MKAELHVHLVFGNGGGVYLMQIRRLEFFPRTGDEFDLGSVMDEREAAVWYSKYRLEELVPVQVTFEDIDLSRLSSEDAIKELNEWGERGWLLFDTEDEFHHLAVNLERV